MSILYYVIGLCATTTSRFNSSNSPGFEHWKCC